MFLMPTGNTVSAPIVAVSNTASAVDTTSQSTYTFSNQSFGAAVADRKIVVIAENGGDVTSLTSITIGGVSATNVITVTSDSQNIKLAMYQADVPTGTTGDVVVVWSAGQLRSQIGVYRITGAGAGPSAATDTASATTASSRVLAVTTTIPANGAVICAAGDNYPRTYTWVNVDEDFDQTSESYSLSGASKAFDTLQTNLAITATQSGAAAGENAISASWGPA